MDSVQFPSVQYGSRIFRVELRELQKANLGRKYGLKDRRPIDPPPIVQLKLIEDMHGAGRAGSDVSAFDDEEHSFGFLCHVDMFSVPGNVDQGQDSSSKSREPFYPGIISSAPSAFSNSSLGAPSALPGPGIAPESLRFSGQSSNSPGSDVIAYAGNFPIKESSNCTHYLAGERVVQAFSLPHQGEETTMFAFSDLSVKIEGTFCLRYRVFNLYSKTIRNDCPILAECFGGPFHIYPSIDFPGLGPSTELTKYCSKFGVRLNYRDGERRKRQRKSTTEQD